jgi:hypothetical protein
MDRISRELGIWRIVTICEKAGATNFHLRSSKGRILTESFTYNGNDNYETLTILPILVLSPLNLQLIKTVTAAIMIA